MIPAGASIRGAKVTAVEQPSVTWRLDLEAGRVGGQVDGLAAIQQAAVKILQTGRFGHLIYSGSYGHELHRLIGRSPLLVQSEAPRMLEEALLQDDRITAVRDVRTDVSGDRLLIECTVVSRYGSFPVRQEVGPDV